MKTFSSSIVAAFISVIFGVDQTFSPEETELESKSRSIFEAQRFIDEEIKNLHKRKLELQEEIDSLHRRSMVKQTSLQPIQSLQSLPPKPPTPPIMEAITFTWDYPDEELSTNLIFHIYSASKIEFPLDQWKLIGLTTNTHFSTQVIPGRAFFVVSASNMWGQSFSEVISTPHPPRSGQNLKVRRGE